MKHEYTEHEEKRNVKVSAEEVESYDIEECTAILNAYMEFVDELKANPN